MMAGKMTGDGRPETGEWTADSGRRMVEISTGDGRPETGEWTVDSGRRMGYLVLKGVAILVLAFLLAACDGPGNGMTESAGITTITLTPATQPDTPASRIASNTPTPNIKPTSTPIQPPDTPTPVPTTDNNPPPITTETIITPVTVTATAVSTEVATIAATALPTPVQVTVNGMAASEFIIMDEAVLENVRTIYARGQELGRDPHRFSKLGDSLVLTSHYFTKFDTGLYTLSPEYAYLQSVIDHFSGSFQRYGVAVKVGLHAWGIFDPFWADAEWCLPGEHMLDCEFRLNNPSILLMRMGTNDNGSITDFEKNMRLAVETTIANGVIPVLGTKADRFEGDNRNNLAIRRIAADYQVPLWDFDLVANTLPGRGISEDNVHLTIRYEHDYTLEETFQYGYPVNDLTGLMMLDAILNQVILAVE